MRVEVVKTDKELPTPKYAHLGDAGMDLYSAVDTILEAGERKMIPTGLKIAVPYGFEVQVRPRSGLAAKFGISVINTPGTIDHQYR
ncbi:MAG: dUTP diphosphatase, partial [Nanoarchaeota archaeon]